MIGSIAVPAEAPHSFRHDRHAEQRYVAWFHELDAWTEYWDIYNPETRGHFYFGDGDTEMGLLTRFLPRERRPPAFVAWTRKALSLGDSIDFANKVRIAEVAKAVMEVDAFLARLFDKYFGDAGDRPVQKRWHQ